MVKTVSHLSDQDSGGVGGRSAPSAPTPFCLGPSRHRGQNAWESTKI